MKKLEDSIHKHPQIWIVSVVSTIFIIIFVGLAILYINKFDETLLEENESHLSEIADHIAIYTKSIVDNTTNALQNAANSLTAIPEEQRLTYMKDIAKRQDFSYVGYANKDGEFYSTEVTQNKNIQDEEYFQNALLGQVTISDLERRIFNDHVVSGIIITVPIYSSEIEASGALLAMIDSTVLDDALEVESFQGEGYSYIINQDGELILHNKSMDYSNFFRILANSDIREGDSLDNIKQRINEGKSGIIHYKQFGADRYAYYTSIGINSWTIVNIVDSTVITAKTDMLIKELVMIAGCVIFAFFVLLILAGISWIVSEKQKHISNSKTMFLANMSHEIRTPMNAIIGTSEVLLRSDINYEYRTHIQNILNSSKSLLAIINDILDFSKIEAGKFVIVDEPYEIESLLYDITALATIRLENKPIYFMIEIADDVPVYLIGDMSRIKQILINLVGNAIKFTQEGYIKIIISLIYKDSDQYLQFQVIDTGIGIRKQNLSKLFISFNQLDTHYNHSQEGTGLGLAISKSLCELMGGEIYVESEYGAGSKFTFTVKQGFQNNERLIKAPIRKNVKLCILETSAILREFYAETLKHQDITYYQCENCKEFLERIQQEQFDYILVDQTFNQTELLPLIKNIKVVTLINQQEMTLFANQQDNLKIYVPLFGLQLSYLLADQSQVYMEKQADNLLSLSKTRVLVVDDNMINREITQEIISFYDIESDGATSGQEALDMLQKGNYDLVFMDHMMPGMDGIETFNAIRHLSEKKYHDLPIIVLTANATENAKQMFLQLGFNGFLTKPIDIKQLSVMLEKWLRPLHDERVSCQKDLNQ